MVASYVLNKGAFASDLDMAKNAFNNGLWHMRSFDVLFGAFDGFVADPALETGVCLSIKELAEVIRGRGGGLCKSKKELLRSSHDSAIVLGNLLAPTKMLAAHMLDKVELATDDSIANQTLVMVLRHVGHLYVLFARLDRLENAVAFSAASAAIRKAIQKTSPKHYEKLIIGHSAQVPISHSFPRPADPP